MTAPNDRAIEALRELVALKDMKDAGWGSQDTETEDAYLARKPAAWSEARAALAAVDAQPAEPVQEPVAWLRFRAAMHASPDGNVEADEWLETCQAGDVGDDKAQAFPVYTTPPAPQRQPLTDEQLRDVFRSTADNLTLRAHWPGMKVFARAVELHHGIGGDA